LVDFSVLNDSGDRSANFYVSTRLKSDLRLDVDLSIGKKEL
jgi:hypothetical protein